MSVLVVGPEAEAVAHADRAARDGLRARDLPGHLLRLAVGVVLCTTLPTALVAVGWTFRLMRRRCLHGLWRRSPVRAIVPFEALASGLALDVPRGPTPRWLLGERLREQLGRPTAGGDPPRLARRLARWPGLLVASLRRNLREGLVALSCTAVLTLPGGLFLLGGWEYGWNIAFYKGYEQAFAGRTVAFLGMLMLAGAMLYVPLAGAHLAATGDPRAFFQFRFVGRLIRRRLAGLTLYATAYVALSAPATLLWILVQFLPQMFPALNEATADELARFAGNYRLVAAGYVFPAYLGVHLLAVRIYRGALLAEVSRDPSAVASLHPTLARLLEALELVPDGAARTRHPVFAAVIVSGRRGTNAVLWVGSFLVWMLLPAQMLAGQFFVWHPWLVWFNPVLVHLPCLWVATG
jgi:hypothetical protein